MSVLRIVLVFTLAALAGCKKAPPPGPVGGMPARAEAAPAFGNASHE